VNKCKLTGTEVTSLPRRREPDSSPAPLHSGRRRSWYRQAIPSTAITGTAALRQAIKRRLIQTQERRVRLKTEIVGQRASVACCILAGWRWRCGAGTAQPFWPKVTSRNGGTRRSQSGHCADRGRDGVLVDCGAQTLREHGDAVKCLIAKSRRTTWLEGRTKNAQRHRLTRPWQRPASTYP
jgi:hypothetical protein